MKKFIRQTFCYLVPLLAITVLSEIMLRKIPNDYTLKADYYHQHADGIETLILGNSYGFYDFDPGSFKSKTFNGAHITQTLDLDAAIFRNYAADARNLKQVIIPVCDESFYFRLFTSTENWRIKNYTLYYHIHSPFRLADYSEILSLPFSINRNRLISYYIKHESPVSTSSEGFGLNFSTGYQHDLKTSAAQSVPGHMAKNDAEMPVELMALNEIIVTCARRNVQVWLIIPPVSREFYATMPPAQINKTMLICDSVLKQNSNVRFLNFRMDPAFKTAEFFDADHLNGKGAKHLSLMVDTILRKSQY